MTSIPSKTQLKTLYDSGLSMMQISKKLKVSHSKIAYWMKQYNIPRRSIKKAAYIKHNPSGNPFKIKKIKLKKDYFIYALGMGIYWGEGNKADKYSVRVGTSDPTMILKFKEFLIKICKVQEKKLKYSLICFKNSSVKKAKHYWSKKLGIKPTQLGKITQIKSLGKGSYHKTSTYGVCTIYVFNIKLKKWILDQLKFLKYNNGLPPT